MTAQFVDTHYFLSLVNSRDQDHPKAVRHSRTFAGKLVTTTWVLVEFADAMCAVGNRERAARFITGLTNQPFFEIVPASEAQFRHGLDSYRSRLDKDWSMTDCLSFLIMQERGITDALTADHHFEQAGFRALLRED